MLAIGPAKADTLTNTDAPFSPSGLPNPCSGELIDVSGVAHFVLHETTDGAGGLHGDLHVNVEAKGVGETSGANYVGNAQLNAGLNIDKTSGQNVTIIANAVLNGQDRCRI